MLFSDHNVVIRNMGYSFSKLEIDSRFLDGSNSSNDEPRTNTESNSSDHDIFQQTKLRSRAHENLSRILPGQREFPVSTVKMLTGREANLSGRGRFSSADCRHVLSKYLPVNGPCVVDQMSSRAYMSQFSADGSLFLAAFQVIAVNGKFPGPVLNFAGDYILMVDRRNCKFTTMANFAEAAGASAVLIVNNEKELYKMVCEPDETDLDIHIPAVMLPQDAGATLEKMLSNGSSVSVQLYSPRRPVVDIAEVFLWLMAVGTILCASYWSAWSAREAAIEQDKFLKDATDELPNIKSSGASSVVDINTTSAILFVVVASCFLILIYKLMSYWFIKFLVVLFCIGGVEGLQTCLVTLLSRWFKQAGESFITVPVLGAISYLTLAVAPFCITLAVVWAVYRDVSFAWIGQDIPGIALIITVLQIVRIPNMKVGTVLLSCAFIYDIFWVFLSKKLFKESVMIVVARGDRSGEDGIPMLLKIQHLFDPRGGYSIIGFGDILLLGLLLAFSLRSSYYVCCIEFDGCSRTACFVVHCSFYPRLLRSCVEEFAEVRHLNKKSI